MNIDTVGVIGAGVMGRGVSQNLAQKGCSVILLDISTKILDQARQAIWDGIRLQDLFLPQINRDSVENIMERISYTTEYSKLSDVDCVIENVTEKVDVKENVFKELDFICPPRCIFASNTSAIPITRLASVTKRASKVIGIHFMNPVPIKTMVEVIRGAETSDETVAIAQGLLASMGKEWIIINDSPGFVSNRVLMLALNEAVSLLQEQVTSAESIDNIFKSCFGHKMGPLETADLIGLDTILYTLEVLYESFKDNKYKPCVLLEDMVRKGRYGQKSGQGFYDYRLGM